MIPQLRKLGGKFQDLTSYNVTQHLRFILKGIYSSDSRSQIMFVLLLWLVKRDSGLKENQMKE